MCMYVLFTFTSVYHKHTHRHQNIGSMGTGVRSGSQSYNVGAENYIQCF